MCWQNKGIDNGEAKVIQVLLKGTQVVNSLPYQSDQVRSSMLKIWQHGLPISKSEDRRSESFKRK